MRTLRYYRTVNLLDAPQGIPNAGYGERHFLQACAVRVLQAQGLPLSRIQSLLFGRSDADLQRVLDSVRDGPGVESEATPLFTHSETWHAVPLGGDLVLLSRRGRLRLTAEQVAAVQNIVRGAAERPSLTRNRTIHTL